MSTSNLYGSRLRCSILSRYRSDVIRTTILELVMQTGISNLEIIIEEDFRYFPQDDNNINEYRFSDRDGLVNDYMRKKLIKWWLNINEDTNKQTPNWDFACEAKINGRNGLILVEAKAYKNELIHKDPWRVKSEQSKSAIAQAISEANESLNSVHKGFNLNWETHYQLSNRFAWSWKLASEGIPVLLIYLGCMNCEDMNSSGKTIFRTKSDWVSLFQNDINPIIPFSSWGTTIGTQMAPFYPILSVMNLQPRLIFRSFDAN